MHITIEVTHWRSPHLGCTPRVRGFSGPPSAERSGAASGAGSIFARSLTPGCHWRRPEHQTQNRSVRFGSVLENVRFVPVPNKTVRFGSVRPVRFGFLFLPARSSVCPGMAMWQCDLSTLSDALCDNKTELVLRADPTKADSNDSAFQEVSTQPTTCL